MNTQKEDKSRCICCGVEFIEGQGFVEPHIFPCANERYGWAFTIKDSERADPLCQIDTEIKELGSIRPK